MVYVWSLFAKFRFFQWIMAYWQNQTNFILLSTHYYGDHHHQLIAVFYVSFENETICRCSFTCAYCLKLLLTYSSFNHWIFCISSANRFHYIQICIIKPSGSTFMAGVSQIAKKCSSLCFHFVQLPASYRRHSLISWFSALCLIGYF